jgi:hypothetical protein
MSSELAYRSLLLVLTLAACGPETVGSEGSAGSTTAMSGSQSESQSESESESESGGEAEDLCGGWSLSAELTGSLSMPGDCDNFVFTGELIEQPEASTWTLDSCPCTADCESPDPHTFTISFSGEGAPELPAMPTCPQIELYRDAQCDVVGVVVRDLDDGNTPVWWSAARNTGIPGFEWLSNQIFDDQLCSDGDDDGPVTTGHAIRYAHDEATIELRPGESGMLESTPLGTIEIHNGNATSFVGDEHETYPSYVVVVQ